MKPIDKWHPAAQAVWFLAVLLPAALNGGIHFPAIALSASLCLLLLRGTMRGRRLVLPLLLLLLCTALNPLFNPRGETVLFFLNDTRITLEALLCGFASGLTASAAVLLFGVFSDVMTSDRLLCVFGILSPKTALVLSMSLRYLSLFAGQTEKVKDAQKGLGLFRKDSLPSKIKGGGRVFSVMVTWALENGIVTAESMEARGYGALGRVRRVSLFDFRPSDVLPLVFSGTLCVLSLLFSLPAPTVYYPVPVFPPLAGGYLVSTVSYLLLCLFPILTEIEDICKWHFSLSKI